ncbi:unnamed protein product, partial [Laminaria digitata]
LPRLHARAPRAVQLQGQGSVPLVHREAERGPDRAPHRYRAVRCSRPAVVLSPALCVPAGVLRSHRSRRGLRSLLAPPPGTQMARRQLPNYIAAARNVHVHSHVLVFDGAYVERGRELVFVPAPPPTPEEVFEVSSHVAKRVASYFIRESGIDAEGLIQDDGDIPLGEGPRPKSGWLLADGSVVESPPRVGSLPTSVAEYRGFSVHAGVAISGHDADGRERLVRYVTRRPFAEQQVQLCRDGR